MLLLIICTLLLSSALAADPVLKQVHVVTRHGARFPLTKKPHNLHEGTPGTLTPTGVQQMHDLGQFLQSVYGDFIPEYTPDTVYLESSAFDRTVISANALAAGLFPTQKNATAVLNVPVYTTEARNDVVIRAYDKCFSLLEHLKYAYEGTLWKEMELDNSDLLLRLGRIDAFSGYADAEGKISLSQLWNVYDAILVAKTECNENDQAPSCTSLDDPTIRNVLSDSDWDKLRKVVHRTEILKYGTITSSHFVSSNIMKRIIFRMDKSHSDVSVTEGGAKFYLYSAHYPVLLGLFSVLQEREGFADEDIPSYASAFIFELFQDRVSGAKTYKLYYRVGHPVDSGSVQHAIHYLAICKEGVECAFQELQRLFEGWSQEEWCRICGNDSADVCLKAVVNGSVVSCEGVDAAVFFSVIIGVIFGSLGVCYMGHCCRRQGRDKFSTNKQETKDEAATEVAMENAEEDHEGGII